MPRPAPARSYDPEQTRQVLLEAALDLFAERGFQGASMKDVADRAGVTKGAFYHHFSTKEDILFLIHDEFIDRALAAQEEALARYNTPTEQLASMAFATTMVCIDYQRQVKIFFREQHLLTGEVRDAIMEKRRRSTALFENTILAGIAANEFAQDIDAGVAALGLLGMWVWTYQWYRPGGRHTANDIAKQFTDMTLRGVGAAPIPALNNR